MCVRKATINDLEIINCFFIEMGMTILEKQDFYQTYRNICLIEVENQVISFICFLVLLDEIDLEALYVKPKFRRNGYGLKLLQKMFGDARKLNCRRVFLEVRESNKAARKLYIENGFIEVMRRRKYYGIEDGIVMKKEFR